MKYCCDYFDGLIPAFRWFMVELDDGVEYLMPYIENGDGEKIRVNHCPVCGAKVRSIRIKEEDFQKAIDHGREH